MRKAEIDIRNFIKQQSIKKLKSQSRLAFLSGKSRHQVSEFLTAKRDINLLTFLNYLQALNIQLFLEDIDTGKILLVKPDDMRQFEIDQFS